MFKVPLNNIHPGTSLTALITYIIAGGSEGTRNPKDNHFPLQISSVDFFARVSLKKVNCR